jgi:hypothetical protein
MTAAAADRKAPQYGTPDSVLPVLINIPVETATTIYAGTLVATNAAGNAVPATASAALKVWGRAEAQVANTGAAGAKTINVKPGVFAFNNSTGADLIAAANVGSFCYAADDNTVALTDRAGTLALAGVIFPFDPSNPTLIQVGIGPGLNTSPYAVNPELASTTTFRARNIVTVAVVLATGLTVATNDGVTNVAGDTVILVAQATPAQNGPYIVGTPVTGVAPLTRPDWYPTGSTQKGGVFISVGGEGTVFKNTTWTAFVAANTFVVDTTDGKFYPEQVSGQTALASGTFTISTVPVFSSKSNVLLSRVQIGGTLTTTALYEPQTAAGATGITPGVIGTAAVVVSALVVAGTSVNASDTSTLNWTIINQA